MSWFLSFLPRTWLQFALEEQWVRSLPQDEQVRLYHFGATGNPEHHPFQWADDLPRAALREGKP